MLLAHTYVLFPLILTQLAKRKSQNTITFFISDSELPFISIILAVYNEQKVIERKIQSILESNYPLNKIEFLIGSDASTDDTNSIIEEFAQKYPWIKLVKFAGRTGKAMICNELVKLAQNPVLIMTDANVFFQKDCLYNLVKHYKNDSIALVGGNIINTHLKEDGISNQEKTYLSLENKIKYQEGILWGTMIGAFGGCYSIRKEYHIPVPPKFFMDDFYITMHVLASKKQAINELNALCQEDVSNKISEEFRRKVRISIGNWQNLSVYKGLLWPLNTGLSFCFLSHKVLRWLGPLFLIVMILVSIPLAIKYPLFNWILFSQCFVLALPFVDELLKRLNIHNKWIRFISHFYAMNLALLVGLFKFIKGVQSNIWKPTERFQ